MKITFDLKPGDDDLILEALNQMMESKQEALDGLTTAYPSQGWTEQDFGIPSIRRLIEHFEQSFEQEDL